MPPARPQGGPGMAPGAGPRPPGQPGAPLPMPGSAPQRPMPMAPGGARPVGGLPGPGHAAPAARAATQPAYPTAPGQVPLGLQPRPAAPAPAPNQAYANGAPPHSQQPTGASPVYQQPSPQQWTQPSPQPSPLQPAPPSQLASQMSGLSISGADGFGQQHAAQSLPGASGPGPAPSSFGAPMGMAAQQQPMMGAPQSMPAGPPAPMPGQFAAMPRPSSRPKRVYAGAPQPGAAVPQPGAAYPGQAMPGQQIPGAQQFQQPDGAGLPAAPAPGFGPTMGMPPNMPGMDSSIQQPPFYNAMPQPAVSPLQQAQMIAATQPSAAAPVQTGPRPGISPKSAAPPNAPRPRIDPNQIPSPVTVQELDQKTYDGQIWSTASRTLPPLASSEVRISDDGNASPRFMRITTYNIPTTEDIANQSHLPVGLVIQPFAQPRYDEDPILVVDLGESGPIRCHRCRGYINSGVKFVDGGQKWTCNLCDFNNEGRCGARVGAK